MLDVGELKLPEAMLEIRGPAKAGDSEDGDLLGRAESSAAVGLEGSILPERDKIKMAKEDLEGSHNDGCLWLCARCLRWSCRGRTMPGKGRVNFLKAPHLRR